jgi:hypothetical protein
MTCFTAGTGTPKASLGSKRAAAEAKTQAGYAPRQAPALSREFSLRIAGVECVQS